MIVCVIVLWIVVMSMLHHLENVVFDCGCGIRWIQLWQQRGEAGLHTQQLYCKNGASEIPLHNMYINNCGV
uniref:Growth factor receptor NTRK leucine rich repeat C-terminal domain-containing protein n=1 Tax=Knipowitschia caucasica TaxID=637954 RepID=A0AAV2LRF2_KNICA